MAMSKPEDVVMPFGKHKGKTLGDILASEPSYLDWLSDADIRTDSLAQAVAAMCTKYAAEIDKALNARPRR